MDIYVSVASILTTGGMAERFEEEIVYVGTDYEQAKSALRPFLDPRDGNYVQISVWRDGKRVATAATK